MCGAEGLTMLCLQLGNWRGKLKGLDAGVCVLNAVYGAAGIAWLSKSRELAGKVDFS